ncbi:MBL fold metallo-hydrolase [Acrocarpospora corrugata]|uniref:MBL fold metallo-hydrolase n=1 Tax=Acrocarpospora corrugata TaxID=35763 RepID=A0A5M3W0X6_9ACTN|nr:alkyl sulfatase dimerization domain-containing protein [Acrocarpospora corrugata]GES01870.1 MBL fold metallo-hydrolase [Acrocarpospora corrugata]
MSETVFAYAERAWQGDLDGGSFGGSHGGEVWDVANGVGWYPAFGNSITFEAGDDLVMFDTGSPDGAAELFRAVRAWTPNPLSTAFYSHGHIDHVFGMEPFDDEAAALGRPRPIVVAHEAVAERFARYALTRGYNGVINRRQFQAPSLEWPKIYRLPDVTYHETMTITRGDLAFRLFHVKGETDDATIAYIPQRKVLCMGDMFLWVTPNCGNPQKVQRYPAEWAYALRRIAGIGAEIMLPSHGAPVFGADRITTALLETAEWLESLVEQTLQLLNEGARLDEIIHAVRPPAHLADRPYLQARYDEPEFVVRNLWRQYGGWYDGNPANLKPAPDLVVAEAIAELAGGPQTLADAALRALADGDLRLASHLAEMAALADPSDEGIHRVRADVYGARAKAERSLMAQGVFTWAAAESQSIIDGRDPETRSPFRR